MGFEREKQERWWQSKRTSSFVGRGRAEASWRKRRSETGDAGFIVMCGGKNVPSGW